MTGDPRAHLPDTPPDADLSGRQLGDFCLLRRLGRGAMAEVYLAQQRSLKRQVAIKVLKSQLAADETYVKRFHNEAQAAASLVHANIVQIHDVGCVDGIHYIAQEYVQGQNLHEWMLRRGTPDAKLALAIMRQVAAALQKAAAAGIVHRDIKPENIMLARGGEVKVADFGLARLTGDGALHLTQVGITMGTPLYMSPEQVEGRALDPRSDIYSFGVTCYHMLAGVPPFRGETALAVAVGHLQTQPERLETLRPDLPVTLCRIVHKMLAKDPGQRYAGARELLGDLRGVRTGDDVADWADESQIPEDAGTESLESSFAATERLEVLMQSAALAVARRRRARAWLAVGVVLALLAGGAAGWSRRGAFLLADAAKTEVPKQNSAEEQLFFAKLRGTEESLRSVEQYFPSPADEYFARLADKELALLYLDSGRLEKVLALFKELAGRTEPEFRIFGLAGQSVVLALKREYAESLQLLEALWPDRQHLEPRMGRRIQMSLKATLNASQERLSRQEAEVSRRWLDADFDLDDPQDG